MLLAASLFVATAYAVGCDVRPDSKTTAGTTPVVRFTVASDPRVVPLGSALEITGDGVPEPFTGAFWVHDTGGSDVRGRRLDLFVEDCETAREFGRRPVQVRVLHVGGTRSARPWPRLRQSASSGPAPTTSRSWRRRSRPCRP